MGGLLNAYSDLPSSLLYGFRPGLSAIYVPWFRLLSGAHCSLTPLSSKLSSLSVNAIFQFLRVVARGALALRRWLHHQRRAAAPLSRLSFLGWHRKGSVAEIEHLLEKGHLSCLHGFEVVEKLHPWRGWVGGSSLIVSSDRFTPSWVPPLDH